MSQHKIQPHNTTYQIVGSCSAALISSMENQIPILYGNIDQGCGGSLAPYWGPRGMKGKNKHLIHFDKTKYALLHKKLFP
jgi:hypothetical protein